VGEASNNDFMPMPYVPVVANSLEQDATPEDTTDHTTENSDDDAPGILENSGFLTSDEDKNGAVSHADSGGALDREHTDPGDDPVAHARHTPPSTPASPRGCSPVVPAWSRPRSASPPPTTSRHRAPPETDSAPGSPARSRSAPTPGRSGSPSATSSNSSVSRAVTPASPAHAPDPAPDADTGSESDSAVSPAGSVAPAPPVVHPVLGPRTRLQKGIKNPKFGLMVLSDMVFSQLQVNHVLYKRLLMM
jgi:hypothetical protein